LGVDDNSRQRNWREFLIGDDPKEPFIRREDWVLGDQQFQQSLQSQAGRPVQQRRGRPPKVSGPKPEVSPQRLLNKGVL
jgi:hypothetical protein